MTLPDMGGTTLSSPPRRSRWTVRGAYERLSFLGVLAEQDAVGIALAMRDPVSGAGAEGSAQA